MIFINPGNHFEAFPFPKEAQLSAGFHVGVADNDGNEDIFLARITLLFLRINLGMDAAVDSMMGDRRKFHFAEWNRKWNKNLW